MEEIVKNRIIRRETDYLTQSDVNIEKLDYTPVNYDYNPELTTTIGKGRQLVTPDYQPLNKEKYTGDGIVQDEAVQLDNGETLEFTGNPYPDGTPVKVIMINKYYQALSEDEITRQEEQKENRERLEQAVEEYDRRKRVEDRREFWDSYEIPIDYKLGVNLRSSQLSQGSSGTGRCKDTVNHLYVCESFRDGRLEREEGWFLCKGESDKASTVDDSLNYYPSDGERYARKVTCSRCLELMSRWETN